jgi:monoamine oxidase
MTRVAIIGGGQGGLITAHLLDCKCPGRLDVTLFEAGDRVGGKILSRRFESARAVRGRLGAIEWRGRGLADAIEGHRAYYDHPAHYLRISILFREPFWRQHVDGSYFQLDAFGGCCVYDEGGRYGDASHGVLSWLLAGEDAMVLNNFADRELVRRALVSTLVHVANGVWLEARRRPRNVAVTLERISLEEYGHLLREATRG